MYNSILIPTDGSDQATNAVKAGIGLAADLGATVHTIHVIDEFEAKIVPITEEQEQKSEEYHEYGEEVTDEVADMAADADVECVTAVTTGVVHEQIDNYVDKNDIELIVMGSRGHTNIEEVVLGSVADKVIRTIDKPVTVVHKEPDGFRL